MPRRSIDDEVNATPTLPNVELPPYVQPTTEELARRKRLIEEAKRLRDEAGPMGISTDDLIHLARAEHGR